MSTHFHFWEVRSDFQNYGAARLACRGCGKWFDVPVTDEPPEPRFTLDQIQEAFSQALYASDAKTTTYDLRDAVLAKLVKP